MGQFECPRVTHPLVPFTFGVHSELPFSLHAGKGKSCMWPFKKVEIHYGNHRIGINSSCFRYARTQTTWIVSGATWFSFSHNQPFLKSMYLVQTTRVSNNSAFSRLQQSLCIQRQSPINSSNKYFWNMGCIHELYSTITLLIHEPRVL